MEQQRYDNNVNNSDLKRNRYSDPASKSATVERIPSHLREELGKPPARGQGLNDWLHSSALKLHGRYSNADIVEILKRISAGMEIKSGEIERQVERTAAFKEGRLVNPTTGTGGYRSWPTLNEGLRAAAVKKYSYAQSDLESVVVEDWNDTEEIIDRLFPGNPLLCCGYSNKKFFTRPRETFRGYLSGMSLIVPSPMNAITGVTPSIAFRTQAQGAFL
jgi:hypothetical protein